MGKTGVPEILFSHRCGEWAGDCTVQPQFTSACGRSERCRLRYPSCLWTDLSQPLCLSLFLHPRASEILCHCHWRSGLLFFDRFKFVRRKSSHSPLRNAHRFCLSEIERQA